MIDLRQGANAFVFNFGKEICLIAFVLSPVCPLIPELGIEYMRWPVGGQAKGRGKSLVDNLRMEVSSFPSLLRI